VMLTKHILSEHSEQVAFVRWFRTKYPNIIIFAIPNGGARGDDPKTCSIRGKILKDEGVLRGVPDLFIPELKLFIEMKSEIGVLSKYQSECIAQLSRVGYQTFVCHGCTEAIEKVSSLSF